MKNQTFTAEQRIDRLGLALAGRLDRDSPELAYDIGERLRAARMQALAARKTELSSVMNTQLNVSGAQATLTAAGGDNGPAWSRWASLLPLVALVFGLIAIQSIQSESSITEIAEVDAALLLDELPPTAYTDPGFLQFLKSNANLSTQAN